MKIVFFQGTFDILNAGHVRAFKLAREAGDRLIVGLNSDELVRWFKHREPVLPFEQRQEIISAIKWVDEVVVCHEPAAIRYLKQFKADVYVLTDEWNDANREAVAWVKEKGGEVIYSPRWPDVLCSTDIRNRIKES